MIELTLSFNDTTVRLRLIQVTGDNEYHGVLAASSNNSHIYNGALVFHVLDSMPQDMPLIYRTLTQHVTSGFDNLVIGTMASLNEWDLNYLKTTKDGVEAVLTVSYRSLVK